MTSGPVSPTELIGLLEKFATSGDFEVLKEIERVAEVSGNSVLVGFAPMAALALRAKQISIGDLRERLMTAEQIRSINVQGDWVQNQIDASTSIEQSQIALTGGQIGGSLSQERSTRTLNGYVTVREKPMRKQDAR